MPSPASSQRGFTLIEMLVVVLIGAIMVSGGLAAYRGVSERENLKQAASTLQSNLRLFQQRALAGEKPTGCSGNLEGFRISNGSSLYSYQVQAECTVSNADPLEYFLGEKIKLQSPLSTDLQFSILRNGVVGSQTITLTTDSGSYSYAVVVESSGVIRGNWL